MANSSYKHRAMKVIHAPLNFAGQANLLSQALRAEGIDSRSYRLKAQNDDSGDIYGYRDDRVLRFSWANQMGDLFRCTQQIIAEKPDIVHLWHRPLIYGAHGDFYNGIDVPFLRLGGARLALRFTGYELRRKSLELRLNPYSPFRYGFDFGFSEDDQKKFYDFIGPYIDAFLVQDPEMQSYCPEARIVPRVLDLARFPVVERQPNARPLVVHAATDQMLKGTRFVLEAVEELRDEGLDFDFRLIENMPNAQALEQYRAADIVIDQLLIGWYGVLAIETMAMGKAVIAYIREDLIGHLGSPAPLLNANPDTIRDVLRTAIKDAQLRDEVGRRARTFVERTHDGRVVAADLVKIYDTILKTPISPQIPDLRYHSTGDRRLYAGLPDLISRVPAANADELKRKFELLASAGTLADMERKLGFSANLVSVMDRIPATTPWELERKLELLVSAGDLPEVERKLGFDQKLVNAVGRIPADTSEELERKLELLSKAGTLDTIERKLGLFTNFDEKLLKLLRRVPARSHVELERKLASLIPKKARAAAIVQAKRQSWNRDSYLVKLAHQIPASNPAELDWKIASLIVPRSRLFESDPDLVRSAVSAGILSSFEANLLKSLYQIPASSHRQLELKIASLIPEKARAAAIAEARRRSSNDDSYLLTLARQIPAATPAELDRKIASLIEPGARPFEPDSDMVLSADAAKSLSSFEVNVLKLLYRIPARSHRQLERKIASLIPKKDRAAALRQKAQQSPNLNYHLLSLARSIPALTPAELEEKLATLVPDNPQSVGYYQSYTAQLVRPSSSAAAAPNISDSKVASPNRSMASVAGFAPFDESLLGLLRRIPAESSEELERKITSLIAPQSRDAAVARAKEMSEGADSYLVNLARHIVARNPRELEQKISLLIPPEMVPAPDGRGSVCIVTRKPIHNITRAPRMAKALVDAGYHVVVVSTALPVQSLRDMCPEVEYLVASYRAFTHDVISRLEERRRKRRARRDKRERNYRAALANGGWRALVYRSGRAITTAPPLRAASRLSWRMFVATPSAFLLTSDTQSFAAVRRDLEQCDVFAIASKYVWILTQWASTHAFAAQADELTAGRHFDIVQAYDNYGLVAGAKVAARTGAKLIYDAVEIATDRVGQDLNILEKIREHLERREETRIFLKADRMLGTGDALAGWYTKTYRIPKPLVMRNCRYYWPYREDSRLRADIGAKPDTRVMLWCGSAYPQQGIEVAIRALVHLPPHVHLAVVTDIPHMWRKYIGEELPAVAVEFGVADRFHILPEREPNDLVPYISGGDLGFVLSVPVNHPNQYYNLPNKFFECVMARLPIGTLAFPEVVSIVNKYEIGAVLDEHDSIKNAEIIQQMLEPEMYSSLKANVMKAAEILCWENESRPYVELVDSLMPGRRREAALLSCSDKMPAQPILTQATKHLTVFGPRCEQIDKEGLAATARRMVGGAIDLSFPRFIRWLRSEGYSFNGFEHGPPRFDQRCAYLRYDVHEADLLPAYVMADLHERLGVVGSFQITWRFSRDEEEAEPYFVKLLDFDRRFVQFGLHAAPAATWYLREKLATGDAVERVVGSERFADWMLDLHAAYCRDGDDAPGLCEIRQGTDDTLAGLAASFRATFGEWKSISGHGNFLTNGFNAVLKRHPEVDVLRPYFYPAAYFAKWGLARFGFDQEITHFASDALTFPSVIFEGSSEELRRKFYRGRVAQGAGFVALLHPASWTCRHNATFFLPEKTLRPNGEAIMEVGQQHTDATAARSAPRPMEEAVPPVTDAVMNVA